ncbi:MAG: HldE protein [Parachlamydiales bacterium]|nr:HldE protein [Parachlamydiales bacterium]
MVALSGAFSHFLPVKVLLCGDLMLDKYTQGIVHRISPEAPVPILHVKKDWGKAGGAGNVIRNLVALGAHVYSLGRVGDDAAGQYLCNALQKEGVHIEGIVCQTGYCTPVKNRIIAEGQQIIRVDYEENIPLTPSLEEMIIQKIPLLLQQIQVVVISDYQKGFLSDRILEKLIAEANAFNIPIVIDPKGNDFTKYAHATIIKPNQKEAYAAAHLPMEASLEEVAQQILKETHVQYLVITRSEEGIALFNRHGQRWDFSVSAKEVKDGTGAGDTVLAFLSFAYANGLDISTAVELSNIAAGIAIEHLGCVVVSLFDFAKRLLEYDVHNKVFDIEHMQALQEVLKKTPVNILCIDTREGVYTALLRAIHHLSQKDQSLLLYIKDKAPNEEVVSLLAMQKGVDFILLPTENFQCLLAEIAAHALYDMQEGKAVLIQDAKLILQNLRKKQTASKYS